MPASEINIHLTESVGVEEEEGSVECSCLPSPTILGTAYEFDPKFPRAKEKSGQGE